MSRPTVFAEQLKDPVVAVLLQEHRADRDALLSSLTDSLQSDARVRAAWLWGSFGRNEADDLSDLDPWLIVADEAAAEMGPALRLYAERTGSFISGGEAPQNAPPGGGYFGSLHEGRHGLLHMDCYWQPQSSVAVVPEQEVLFDRLKERSDPAELPPPVSAPTLSEDAASIKSQVEGGLGFAWLMFSIAAKYLARDPASDMGLMLYPRQGLEEAITLLGQGRRFCRWVGPCPRSRWKRRRGCVPWSGRRSRPPKPPTRRGFRCRSGMHPACGATWRWWRAS